MGRRSWKISGRDLDVGKMVGEQTYVGVAAREDRVTPLTSEIGGVRGHVIGGGGGTARLAPATVHNPARLNHDLHAGREASSMAWRCGRITSTRLTDAIEDRSTALFARRGALGKRRPLGGGGVHLPFRRSSWSKCVAMRVACYVDYNPVGASTKSRTSTGVRVDACGGMR